MINHHFETKYKNQRPCLAAFGESLTSRSQGTKRTGNQAQESVIKVVELRLRLCSQPQCRALTGKESDAGIWNGLSEQM